jgi:hypothetical protein
MEIRLRNATAYAWFRLKRQKWAPEARVNLSKTGSLFKG